jgi:hypothetical protein
MEREYLTQGFRARAAQLLSWLTGIQQQERQQQTVQTDRQLFDGATRGNDDPDNRRQQPLSGQAQQTSPGGVTRADMEAFRARMQANPAYQREMDSGYRPPARESMAGRSLGADGPDDVRLPREMGPATGSDAAALLEARLEANRARHEQDDALHGPAQDRLAAQLQAVQERLQAQQRAQQQSRSRGQGMGW